MSRIGAKTYGRKTDCKSSLRFDQLLAEKSNNKPSTAKVSMTALHRWGVTSFTSLRKTHINGQKDVPEKVDPVKRLKLDTPPLNPLPGDPFSFDTDPDTVSQKNVTGLQLNPASLPQSDSSKPQEPVAPVRPRKFFKTGSTRVFTAETDCILPSQLNVKLLKNFGSFRRADDKPPIVQLQSSDSFAASSDYSQTPTPHIGMPKQDVFQVSCSMDTSTSQESRGRVDYSCSYKSCPPVSHPSNDPENDSSLHVSDSWSNLSAVPSSETSKESESSSKLHRSGALRVYSRVPQTDTSVKTSSTMISNVSSSSTQQLSLSSECPDDQRVLSDSVDPLEQDNFTQLPMSQDNGSTQNDDWSLPSSPKGSSESHSDNGQSCSQDNLEAGKDGDAGMSEDGEKSQHSNFKMRRIFNTHHKHKAKYNHRHWQSQIREEEDELQEKKPPKVSLADEFEDEIEEGGADDRDDDPEDDDDDDGDDDEEEVQAKQPALTKVVYQPQKFYGEPRTSYKCLRKEKELYTVIRNVKQAHQCHEIGEAQEFNDDVEYLLDGIQPENSSGTRCLSIISLATKCMVPSFRVHLRAHGIIPKIFSALMDAPSDLNVSLCTATLMFVLSQDRLTMDIESSTLSLMLQLLECDQSGDSSQASDLMDSQRSTSSTDRNLEKVRQICEQMQQKGHAHHLDLDHINTGTLAMETLLSLTSRKAGEWFKEGLRSLGGLDHIVDTVNSCSEGINPKKLEEQPSKCQLDTLQKIERCLRVLENVTYMNSDNQAYLLNYDDTSLVASCARLLCYCRCNLMYHPMVPPDDDLDVSTNAKGYLDGPGPIFLSLLLSLLKVLVNLTQDTSLGSKLVGSQKDLLDSVLLCILQAPRCIPVEQRFDLMVLTLGLMINLVEHCEENRAQLVVAQTVGSFDSENDGGELTALEALVEVFFGRLEAAKQSEEQADALLSSQELSSSDTQETNSMPTLESSQQTCSQSSQMSQVEALEETLMKALQKAGKHMEHSIIGAYIALLLGCVIQNNEDYSSILRDHIPDGNFTVLIDVLKKFHSFVNLSGCISNTGAKSIQHVIDIFESS